VDPHIAQVLNPGNLHPCQLVGVNEFPTDSQFIDPLEYDGAVEYYPYDTDFVWEDVENVLRLLKGTSYAEIVQTDILYKGQLLGINGTQAVGPNGLIYNDPTECEDGTESGFDND
jgi:hypothetical protein